LGLVNGILDFSRMESGKVELEKRPFDIWKAVDEATAKVLPKAFDKKISVNTQIMPNVSHIVIGDGEKLKQALDILLSNSVKFTSAGEINVKVSMLKESKQELKLKFEISDTGVGIPKDKLDMLFQHFTQLDSTVTRKYGGIGLGLAICKKIVELMDGEIWVESKEEKGSTFIFTAKFLLNTSNSISVDNIADEKVEKINTSEVKVEKITEEVTNVLLEKNGNKVLLVEDNKMNQKFTKNLICELGFECDVAESVEEAFNKLSETTYDLILLECQMKNTTGFEVADKMMKEVESCKTTPIIGMTAKGKDEDIEKYNLDRMKDFILKPVEVSELERIFKKYMN